MCASNHTVSSSLPRRTLGGTLPFASPGRVRQASSANRPRIVASSARGRRWRDLAHWRPPNACLRCGWGFSRRGVPFAPIATQGGAGASPVRPRSPPVAPLPATGPDPRRSLQLHPPRRARPRDRHDPHRTRARRFLGARRARRPRPARRRPGADRGRDGPRRPRVRQPSDAPRLNLGLGRATPATYHRRHDDHDDRPTPVHRQ